MQSQTRKKRLYWYKLWIKELQMGYRDAFRPCSRVSSGEKKIMQISKKSGKHSNGKIYKRISNYITGFDVITYALVNFSIAVLT